jgi:hypothetical protein
MMRDFCSGVTRAKTLVPGSAAASAAAASALSGLAGADLALAYTKALSLFSVSDHRSDIGESASLLFPIFDAIAASYFKPFTISYERQVGQLNITHQEVLELLRTLRQPASASQIANAYKAKGYDVSGRSISNALRWLVREGLARRLPDGRAEIRPQPPY